MIMTPASGSLLLDSNIVIWLDQQSKRLSPAVMNQIQTSPQVYLSAPDKIPGGAQFPAESLVAFDRVHVPAGESKTVTLHVATRQLQYWSTDEASWVIPNGKRTISVGGSSRNLRLNQTVD